MRAAVFPTNGQSLTEPRKAPRYLMAGGVLLILLLAGAVALTIWRLRNDALEDARRDTANLALVLGEQTSRAVQAVDLMLRDLQDTIAQYRATDAADLKTKLGTQGVHHLLRDRLARIPQADALTIVGADGKVVNFSRRWPTPDLDLSDRDYYRHFRDVDDAAIFISEPARNRTDGQWTVYMVRRLNGAGGSFLGVVLGAVPISYFESIYKSISLPRNESFLLLRRDGTVLVRHPDPQRRAGQRIPAGSPWFGLVLRGGGNYISPGYFDGQPRMIAVQPLRDYPLVLNVAVPENATLATWWSQFAFIAAGSIPILLFAAFLLRTVARQFAQLRASETSLTRQNEELVQLSRELTRSEQRVAEKSRELEATLETMDQGLLMVDSDGKVVVCNRRAKELLSLTDELVQSGPSYIDIIEHRWTADHGADKQGFAEFIEERMALERPRTIELRRANGTVIEARSTPSPDGGMVCTYTDITARKAVEEKTRYLAQHDDLTRLENRAAFHERLQDAIAMSEQTRRGLAVFFLDLDRFKQVNDTLGHHAGDQVLTEAAQRVRAVVRATDTVARMGGDEFAVILPFLEDIDVVRNLASRLVTSVSQPYATDAGPCSIGVSVGVAFFPEDGRNADDLLAHADEALYRAKAAGRGTYRLYGVREPLRVAAARSA